MDKVLTASEVAVLCGVNRRTVIRWIARGELEAYKLPGRGDHRVLSSRLRSFMKEHAMPEPAEFQETSKRILIAEDEPAMARAINRVLVRAGYETAIASDGFLAGSLLHTFRPALMTLDLRMPGVDGLGVLRVLRSMPLSFPLKILVVSADTPDRLNAALGLGADSTLSKPFSNEELLAAVQHLFDGR